MDTDPHVEKIMAAAHHAYCVDTGCFDGDDISLSDEKAAPIRQAIIAYGAREREAGRLEALENAAAYFDQTTWEPYKPPGEIIRSQLLSERLAEAGSTKEG